MSTALSKHHRLEEIAEMWGVSKSTVYRHFRNEPGLLRLSSGNGDRHTIAVPETVLNRVYTALTGAAYNNANADHIQTPSKYLPAQNKGPLLDKMPMPRLGTRHPRKKAGAAKFGNEQLAASTANRSRMGNG